MFKEAIAPATATGAAIITYASDIGSLISIIIGIVAGILTIRFMRLRNKRTKLEIEELEAKKKRRLKDACSD